jgi:hypothetical protein
VVGVWRSASRVPRSRSPANESAAMTVATIRGTSRYSGAMNTSRTKTAPPGAGGDRPGDLLLERGHRRAAGTGWPPRRRAGPAHRRRGPRRRRPAAVGSTTRMMMGATSSGVRTPLFRRTVARSLRVMAHTACRFTGAHLATRRRGPGRAGSCRGPRGSARSVRPGGSRHRPRRAGDERRDVDLAEDLDGVPSSATASAVPLTLAMTWLVSPSAVSIRTPAASPSVRRSSAGARPVSSRPDRMIATRSHSSSASARLWVESSTVRPRSRDESTIRSRTPRAATGSMFVVGSSSSRICGSCTSARARATRCFSPAERPRAGSSRFSARPRRCSSPSIRWWATSSGMPLMAA